MSGKSIFRVRYELDELPPELLNGRQSYRFKIKRHLPKGGIYHTDYNVYVRHDYSGYYHYLHVRRCGVLYKVYIGAAGKISKDDLLTAVNRIRDRLSRS
jgi:hypothetical protein